MRRVAALFIAVLLIVRVPLHAQDLLYSYFTDYLDALRTQTGIPGLAAAIVSVDGTVKEFSFGQKDIERSDPTYAYTPFHFGGLTQIVTASIVLRCVEEGRLRSEEHTSELQSQFHLVCRLLLEKKKTKKNTQICLSIISITYCF